ncbi:hypothetical protein EV426DRAFT_404137 [Tirmania nivea]|nr:hypothetical protein EV426DRAFT_404137 [Tirmania nivea]
MYTASVMTRHTMVSTMMQSVQAAKPQITITFKGEGNVAARYFTTRDTIEGEVSLVALSDTRFDEIYIGFEGIVRVWMERYGAAPGGPMLSTRTVGDSQRQEYYRTPFLTTRQFLKLSQPVDESSLPHSRIAEKGRRYIFPFVFVVPERLLPTMCAHRHKNATVEDAHMQLPPSLGDGTAPAYSGCTYDDISPDMTRISYGITVKILRRRDSYNKSVTLAEETRKVRILPAYEDLPPVMVDPSDKDLALRKERTIRKGFLKGKLGRLVVEAQQPSALHTLTSAACPPATIVPVTVTFYPADPGLQPPALNTLSTKLRTHTFFSTNPIMYFPVPSHVALDSTLGRYHEASFVGAQNLSGVKWNPHYTLGGIADYYTTELTLPIVTPKCKYLVPSFHSCLVSRSYTIEVHLDVHTPGYNMGSHPGVTLKIPLQVSNPISEQNEGQSDEEVAAEVDEFLTPRSIAPPEGIPLLSEYEAGVGEGGGSGSGVEHQLPPFMRVHRPNMPPPSGYSFFPGAYVPVRIPSPVGVSPGCG